MRRVSLTATHCIPALRSVGGVAHLVFASEVRRRDSQAEILVSDDGFGVDPALRSTLFERESRGSGSGTGLGLYIVRRVAENAGGSVRYDPKPRGSLFTLSLPEACS